MLIQMLIFNFYFQTNKTIQSVQVDNFDISETNISFSLGKLKAIVSDQLDLAFIFYFYASEA